MILNLETLRSELANMIKATAVSNDRRDRWLNLGQSDVATAMDPDHLIHRHTFTTSASTRRYNVPFEMNRIISVRDTTNDIEVWPVTENEIEEVDPDLGDSGSSYNYSTDGLEWVEYQPTSASVLTIVSSSTNDTTQSVRVSGIKANGVWATEKIDLNGTTDVSGSVQFEEIKQLVKSTSTTGDITVTSNSAAVTNVIIPAYELAVQYQPMNFYPVPSGTNTMVVRGFRQPRRMVNVEDIPDFPGSWHELVLIAGCIRGHLDRMRPSLALNIKKNMWDPKVKELKGEMGNKRGKVSPVVQGTVPVLFGGRLPSNYPL